MALAIAVLWAVGYVAAIATGDPAAMTAATPVMLLACAYLLR